MVDDAADDLERIVAGTPDESIDGVADPVAGGFGEHRDDAGRRHEQPRRTAAADESAEAGDDAGVDDDDRARRTPASR